MPLRIPKQFPDFLGYGFDLVMPVNMNDVSVESVMIRVMELCVRGGRSSRYKTVPTDFDRYAQELAGSSHVRGFVGAQGLAALSGWLRCTMVRFGRMGLGRHGSQMTFLKPLSVATYRSGLPKDVWRFRKADVALYKACRDYVASTAHAAARSTVPEQELRELFKASLGQNVSLGTPPFRDPSFDEAAAARVDVVELLQLRFLEVFEPGADTSKEVQTVDSAMDDIVLKAGQDICAILKHFGHGQDAWAPAELMAVLTAIVSFHLFQLPIRSALRCADALDGTLDVDLALDGDNPFEMYVDITRGASNDSLLLSRRCVARDLERMRHYFLDRVHLRTIAALVGQVDELRDVSSGAPPLARLAELGRLHGDARLKPAAAATYMFLQRSMQDGTDGTDAEVFFTELDKSSQGPVEKLITTQVSALSTQALMGQHKWFWSTGGLVSGGQGGMHPFALLRGNSYSPNWSYSPSDELLSALVTACFMEESWSERPSEELPLADLLSRLERRYGVLIARPPVNDDEPASRNACAANLAAFTQKLKQLGCYGGLTDDFTAQRVRRPGWQR